MQAALNMFNRRARKEFFASAKIALGGQTPLLVQTVDLSIGGLSIITNMKMRVGQLCSIEFVLPCAGKPQAITAMVEVRNCLSTGESSFRIGLRFADIKPAHMDAVISLISG